MGWNRIDKKKQRPFVKRDLDRRLRLLCAFVLRADDNSVVATTTDYGNRFASECIATERLFACQFHPEKSQELGLRILANFARFVNGN
jgi:glutamine amidotransferase